MDSAAIYNDLRKALKLICQRHGVNHNLTLKPCADGIMGFELFIGEHVDGDYRLYLLHHEPELVTGHNLMKREYPKLHGDMLGKRFHFNGKTYIYLGCKPSRPKYPFTMLEIKPGGGTQRLKADRSYLEAMIKELWPKIEQKLDAQSRARVQGSLSSVDPELASEANFA